MSSIKQLADSSYQVPITCNQYLLKTAGGRVKQRLAQRLWQKRTRREFKSFGLWTNAVARKPSYLKDCTPGEQSSGGPKTMTTIESAIAAEAIHQS